MNIKSSPKCEETAFHLEKWLLLGIRPCIFCGKKTKYAFIHYDYIINNDYHLWLETMKKILKNYTSDNLHNDRVCEKCVDKVPNFLFKMWALL